VAKYTGSLQGSKRSWNAAGKARFNDLMVEVYNDRTRNGARFNQRWKKRVAMAFRKKDSSSKKIVVKVMTTYDDIKFAEMMKDDNVYKNTVGPGQERSEDSEFSDDDDVDKLPLCMMRNNTVLL
jgi:hypothetical protein